MPKRLRRRFSSKNTVLLHAEVPITDFIVETMILDIPWVPNPVEIAKEGAKAFLETVLPWSKIPISKPALAPRAPEIARALQSEYHIAALSEAFDANELNLILEAWPPDQQPSTAAAPAKSGAWVVLGSGLFTISSQREILSSTLSVNGGSVCETPTRGLTKGCCFR